jgi:hypothetical protein
MLMSFGFAGDDAVAWRVLDAEGRRAEEISAPFLVARFPSEFEGDESPRLACKVARYVSIPL